eukprot:6421815-Karenia_brevis.AAC.1
MILCIAKVLLLRPGLRVVCIWPSRGLLCLAAPALARVLAPAPARDVDFFLLSIFRVFSAVS